MAQILRWYNSTAGLLQTDKVLEWLVLELVVMAGHSLVLVRHLYNNMVVPLRMDTVVECFLVVKVSPAVGTGCLAADIRIRPALGASLSPHSRTLLALGKALAAAVKEKKKKKVVVIRWFDGQTVVTVEAVNMVCDDAISD